MRVDRIKNFISKAECDALNAWVDEAAENRWMDKGVTPTGEWTCDGRLTTRIYGDRFVYPQLVIDIRDRITAYMGLEKFPLIYNHGRDGVVVSRTDVGTGVHEHGDPPSPDHKFVALRCNILTRKPAKGGELFARGRLIDIDVGELHCYEVCSNLHSVSTVEEGPSRILWMFGAYVPSDYWE